LEILEGLKVERKILEKTTSWYIYRNQKHI